MEEDEEGILVEGGLMRECLATFSFRLWLVVGRRKEGEERPSFADPSTRFPSFSPPSLAVRTTPKPSAKCRGNAGILNTTVERSLGGLAGDVERGTVGFRREVSRNSRSVEVAFGFFLPIPNAFVFPFLYSLFCSWFCLREDS